MTTPPVNFNNTSPSSPQAQKPPSSIQRLFAAFKGRPKEETKALLGPEQPPLLSAQCKAMIEDFIKKNRAYRLELLILQNEAAYLMKNPEYCVLQKECLENSLPSFESFLKAAETSTVVYPMRVLSDAHEQLEQEKAEMRNTGKILDSWQNKLKEVVEK